MTKRSCGKLRFRLEWCGVVSCGMVRCGAEKRSDTAEYGELEKGKFAGGNGSKMQICYSTNLSDKLCFATSRCRQRPRPPRVAIMSPPVSLSAAVAFGFCLEVERKRERLLPILKLSERRERERETVSIPPTGKYDHH